MKRLVVNVEVMDFDTGTETDLIVDVEYDGELDNGKLLVKATEAIKGELREQAYLVSGAGIKIHRMTVS